MSVHTYSEQTPPDDRDWYEDEDDDSPYCECNEIPTEDEDASNTCASCGKPLFAQPPKLQQGESELPT